MLDKLSIAAAEKARSDRICVRGIRFLIAGLPILIFLGTTIVSPGSRLEFLAKTLLPVLSTSPFAFIT